MTVLAFSGKVPSLSAVGCLVLPARRRTGTMDERDPLRAKMFGSAVTRIRPIDGHPKLQALIKSAGVILPTHTRNSGVVVSTRKKLGRYRLTP